MTGNKSVTATFTLIPPGASQDKILSALGTSRVAIGQTYNVTVNYDAKADRYINVEFKIPNSTVFVNAKQLVSAGTGLYATIPITIPSNTPVDTKLEYVTYLSLDGSWSTKLSYIVQGGVYASGNSSSITAPNSIAARINAIAASIEAIREMLKSF